MDECSDGSCFSTEEDIRCPGPLFRTKLYVFGERDDDKTKLIHSLIGTRTNMEEGDDKEDVHIELWYPFKTSDAACLLDRPITGVEHHLTFEIWQLSGRKICQTVLENFLTPEAMYIIVYDTSKESFKEFVTSTYMKIVQRFPDSPVYFVSVNGINCEARNQLLLDRLQTLLQEYKLSVQHYISELSTLSNGFDKNKKHHSFQNGLKNNPVPYSSIVQEQLRLENVLNRLPYYPETIYNIQLTSNSGVRALKTVILKAALDRRLYPHLDLIIKSCTINLYDEILKLREGDVVIQTCSQFKEITSQFPDFHVEDHLEFLEKVGGVLNLQPYFQGKAENEKLICVYPSAFVNIICSLLVGDEKRDFKLKSQQFWPHDSGFKPPEPMVLSKVLDSIPNEGLVREAVLPLLWQTYHLPEEQVVLLIKMINLMGVVIPYKYYKQNCEGLAIPDYPKLSVQKSYMLTFLNKLPNTMPQLNWTTKPLKGDIQITWRYEMSVEYLPGFKQQIIGICQTSKPPCCSYQYLWKNGILFKVKEVCVCIEDVETGLDISCRTNADDIQEETGCIKMVWFCLAWFLTIINNVLNERPYLFYKTKIKFNGHQFYTDNKINTVDSLVDVSYCLSCWRSNQLLKLQAGDSHVDLDLDVVFPFKGNIIIADITSWLEYVQSQAEYGVLYVPLEIKKNTKLSIRLSRKKRSFQVRKASNQTILNSLKFGRHMKKNEIKWKLDEESSPSHPSRSEYNIINDQDNSTTDITNTPVIVMDSTCNNISPVPVSVTSNEKSTESSIICDSASGLGITEEVYTREINRIASCLVASILASSFAQVIEEEYLDGNLASLTPSQVKAAKITADATRATQSGDIEGAIKAVMQAVQLGQPQTDELILSTLNYKKKAKSKTCCVL